MRNLRLLCLALMSIALVSVDAGAQQVIVSGPPGEQPIQLPGMGPRQVKTGTGRIRGRVVASDTGSPVRRAQVRISGGDAGARASMTDADGRFEFRDLPAGRFTLTAQKPGFMTTQYGQSRPFESGKAIELADGQLADKISIAMPRGSVISGRIVDEFGDPLPDATVGALRSTWSNGRRRLQPAGRATQTNDLGQYRIFGLPPGDYYVTATYRGGEMAMMEVAMIASMTPGGPSGSSPNSGYAATYFPGTANAADAQRISVAVGQESQGNDFALSPVRLAKISGTVIGSDGKPVEGSTVNALPRSLTTEFVSGMGNVARTDRNGNFTMANVPPGDYTLQTRGGVMMFMSGDGNNMTVSMTRVAERGGPGGPSGPPPEPEFGTVPVTVAGDDITNVVIMTTKGTTASGKVTFDGGVRPEGAGSLRIMAASVDPDLPTIGGLPAPVAADGTFELKGLAGPRMLRLVGLPQGWVLQAVRVNGQDITDTGIEFRAEPVTGIEIAVTNRTTDVSGSVHETSGDAVKDYTVVFFADEPSKWTLPQTRYVTAVRPDTEGRYRVKNLPPGGYYAIAMDYIAQGEWGNPELLQRLSAKATRIELGEGEIKTQDLKIVR